jgi:hypothetical protein
MPVAVIYIVVAMLFIGAAPLPYGLLHAPALRGNRGVRVGCSRKLRT